MSKNLGNIPRQVKMTEEQEQTFTNGINKGRKLENERVLRVLRSMQETALATSTRRGKQTAWVLENAVVLIQLDRLVD